MEYLFSDKNIELLESFALVHTLFGFDFDGTLAPIANDPSRVALPDECVEYLKSLCADCPVAILTGRSVDDVKKLLPFKPRYIIGNHGVEGMHTENELKDIMRAIEKYKVSLIWNNQEILEKLGITVEDKIYTLSLHYRNSAYQDEAEKFLRATLVSTSEVKVSMGKMVCNIISRDGLTKGQAFMRLMASERANFGFFIGDDNTDEDVFIYKNSRLLTVRVGYSPTSHAGYYIHSQDEILKIFEILCRRRTGTS